MRHAILRLQDNSQHRSTERKGASNKQRWQVFRRISPGHKVGEDRCLFCVIPLPTLTALRAPPSTWRWFGILGASNQPQRCFMTAIKTTTIRGKECWCSGRNSLRVSELPELSSYIKVSLNLHSGFFQHMVEIKTGGVLSTKWLRSLWE